jgi:hypothetical protein
VGSPAACGTVSGYTFGCGPGGAAFSAPYSYFNVSNISDIGKSHYDSLQIKAETKSARHGLYALLGYTFSRNHDNGLSDGLGSELGSTYWPLPNLQNADWALSQINLNHSFTASLIYQLPFGKGKQFGSGWNSPVNTVLGNWELDVIEKATSGFPVFIIDSNNTSGVNFQNNGNSFSRPNLVCEPGLSNPMLSAWFKTSCFAAPVAGELGNASRTPVSGPGFTNTDFSAIKHFPITENIRVDFRAEIFNLFNHPQFGQPAADFNTPATFGAVSSTVNNPRLVQFALKLAF